MEGYKHVVQYYETDRMGITHHSNYIRWMEEARIDFLNQLGLSYERMEEEGIISPVTAVECRYRHSTTFPDQVTIKVHVQEFRGIKLKLSYTMTNQEGLLVCEGTSQHGFLNRAGEILRMDKEFPQYYQLILAQKEE